MNTSFFGKIWTVTKSVTGKSWHFIVGHKIISGIVVLILIGGGYYAYTVMAAGNAGTQYVLAATTQGPLNVTVTGSGQVAAQDTLNLTPQASAQIEKIEVTPGESVKAGTIVAELDLTTPAEAVESAQEDLTSAKISYQQALSSSQTGTTDDQQSISTAQSNLNSDIATTMANLPGIMTGLDGLLHNNSILQGYTAESNIVAYGNYIATTESKQDEANTQQAYETALASFQQTQALYAASGPNPTAAQMEQLAESVVQSTNDINTALQASLTYYNYISQQMSASKLVLTNDLSTQISSLTSYENTVTSDNTTVSSANNTLMNAEQTLANDTQSLPGNDTSLTIQSAELNVQKAQESLDQAEQNEENYIVRAPFDGVIATVPAHVYDQASSGTTVATLITTQEYATLSLNETDAAKVKVGQPATITFDALPNLTMQGTVAEIDGIGTVSQGVVTYTVEVGFNQQNSAIKPGMTADATITTASEANAIQVPSAAVKTSTSGGMSYVEVATLTNASSTLASARSGSGSGTSATGRRTRTASSTSAFAGFGAGAGASSTSSTTPRIATTRSLTVPAANVTIKNVPVVVGVSNDTMTEILSGLTPGEYVVTSTQNSSTATTKTSAASATSLLGGSTTGRGTTSGLGGGGYSGGGGGRAAGGL